ncbi:DNA replication complex GINS protein PSF3 [Candida viswanathii]|uniref:DNA replication complex GINS protein PSF3 n=1 Tax=Candida viswanathii TaxID=5486 RepID=A0A367YHP4_9ASCO|nr:DNA replication complex GINS protein PSF3 [Candida viswanathii]
MSSNYYDLDDILTEAEKVPTKFNITVPGLGYLEGNPGKPIHEDTKIELPLWLAKVLATLTIDEESNQSFIDLKDPEFINTKVMNAIKTDPASIDLHTLAPYYYAMVLKWGSMYSDEKLIENVMNCLKSRSLEIYNFSNNANKTLNNEFLYSLDEFEKVLFKLTSEGNKLMRQWFKR